MTRLPDMNRPNLWRHRPDSDWFAESSSARKYRSPSPGPFICWATPYPPLRPPNSWTGSVTCRRPAATETGGLRRSCNGLGVDITIEEVQRLGRSLAGRPHFARIWCRRVTSQARMKRSSVYLDESDPGVCRTRRTFPRRGHRADQDAGGISSLAHPIRLGKRDLSERKS